MTEARRSIRQYTEGMVCADNSDFNAQVQKAKTDGLPTAELTELFEKLLDEDRKLEDRLGNQVSAADDPSAKYYKCSGQALQKDQSIHCSV